MVCYRPRNGEKSHCSGKRRTGIAESMRNHTREKPHRFPTGTARSNRQDQKTIPKQQRNALVCKDAFRENAFGIAGG